MFEQPAGRVEADVTEAGIAVAGEERLAALPERGMRVHAAAVVLEDRLRHERDRLAVAARDVLADVLVPHELIGHLDERLELHVDLALAGRRHLVVMRLDDDADLLHLGDHLAAQIVVGIGGAHRKVAALEARLVAEVRLFDPRRVPGALRRIDLVVAAMLVLLVADLVEDEELGLGADVAGVGNAGLLQVRLGLARHVARIAAELLPGNRVDHVRNDADRRLGEERIDRGGRGIGHRQHVRFVDAHPAANRRPVEAKPLREGIGVPQIDRKRAVLPAAEHVDELEIHHVGFVFLGELEEIVRRHMSTPFVRPEA